MEAQSEGLGKGSTFQVCLPSLETVPELTLVPVAGTTTPLADDRILILMTILMQP